MSKYEPLGVYLRQKSTAEVPMTFREIEQVIGTSLPPKAQNHPAWWSNSTSNNVMTRIWLEAGFKTERVDVAARRLVFRRAGPRPVQAPGRPALSERSGGHPLFGALKGTVTVAPGVDLTAPSDELWDAEA